MLNWISGLTSEGRSDGAMHDAEAGVKALGNQWFAADHDAKLACGQLVIEALKKLMPDYDLSRRRNRVHRAPWKPGVPLFSRDLDAEFVSTRHRCSASVSDSPAGQ